MSVRTGGGETTVERGQRFEASDGRGGGRERDLRRDEPRRQDQQQHAVQLKMRPRLSVTVCAQPCCSRCRLTGEKYGAYNGCKDRNSRAEGNLAASPMGCPV